MDQGCLRGGQNQGAITCTDSRHQAGARQIHILVVVRHAGPPDLGGFHPGLEGLPYEGIRQENPGERSLHPKVENNQDGSKEPIKPADVEVVDGGKDRDAPGAFLEVDIRRTVLKSCTHLHRIGHAFGE